MPSAAPNAFRSQNVASAPNPGAADLGRFMCSPHRKHRLNQRSNVPALHDHDIVVRWVEGLGQSRHVRCREEGPGRPLKYNGDAWRSIDDGPKPLVHHGPKPCVREHQRLATLAEVGTNGVAGADSKRQRAQRKLLRPFLRLFPELRTGLHRLVVGKPSDEHPWMSFASSPWHRGLFQEPPANERHITCSVVRASRGDKSPP